MDQLTIETFAELIPLLEAHIRTRESEQISPRMLQVKFQLLQGEYPELTTAQFVWAVEQWIQATKPDAFLRMPTWAELLAPLYRCENSRPNRSWGFRADLPPFLQPQQWQLALLPERPVSIAPREPGQALPLVGAAAAGGPLVPAPEPKLLKGSGLTPEQWAAHLAARPPAEANKGATAPAKPRQAPVAS